MCTKRRAVLQFRHCVEWFAKKEILNSHKKKKVHSVVKHSQRTYIKYVHHVQIHKGQHKFLVVFRKKIEFLTACRLVKEKSWGFFWGGGRWMSAARSAGVRQACKDVARRPAILSLGVSDGPVLLSQVKPQLTLVSEVEVTFFTLK